MTRDHKNIKQYHCIYNNLCYGTVYKQKYEFCAIHITMSYKSNKNRKLIIVLIKMNS